MGRSQAGYKKKKIQFSHGVVDMNSHVSYAGEELGEELLFIIVHECYQIIGSFSSNNTF